MDPPLRWEVHGYEPRCFVAWAPQGLPLDQRAEVFFGLDLLDLAEVCWGPLPTAPTVDLFDAERAGRQHTDLPSPAGPLRRSRRSPWAGGPPAGDAAALYQVQRCYNAYSPARYPLAASAASPDERPVAIGWPGLSAWLAEACRPELIEGPLLSDDGLWEETAERFFLFLEVTTRTYLQARRADLVLVAEDAETRHRIEARWPDALERYAALLGRVREHGLERFLVPAAPTADERRQWLEAGATGFYADGERLDLAALRKELGTEVVLVGGLVVDDLRAEMEAIERRVAEMIEPAAAEGPVIVSLEQPVPADVPLDHYRAYLNFVERPPWFEYFVAQTARRAAESANGDARDRPAKTARKRGPRRRGRSGKG